MIKSNIFRRWASPALMAGLVGCAVDLDDLERWESTLGGPKRLSAVVLHDKYPHELRVQAASSLIDMKPRKGRHVGIDRLVRGALVCDSDYMREGEPCLKHALDPESRARLVADLVPRIIEELAKPPPPPAQAGQTAPDPSFNYKDAAYLMLSYEKEQVIADAALREQLQTALVAWAMADFERRLNDRSQAYGMEQLLNLIGAASVEGLPKLMNKEAHDLSKMAEIVARIGSKETKEEAGKQLVAVATYTASEQWRKDKEAELREANRRASLEPTDDQFKKQMEQFQNESVVRIFGSMKRIGGEAVKKYALEVAAESEAPEARRQVALAALEGHVTKKDTKAIQALIELAKSDKTPGVVVDQAFRRLKELPRDEVAEALYGFLDSSDWKKRRAASATLLQMSTVRHIDEFLEKLDAKATKNFDLSEAITYGAYLATLKEGDPLPKLEPHMARGKAPSRLSALAYWYEAGTKADVDKVKPFANDSQKVPECEEDGDCKWSCFIASAEKKDEKVEKKVETVGDFVSYCLMPKMATTEKKAKAPEGKKTEGSDDIEGG
jgi:hypothetical protein